MDSKTYITAFAFFIFEEGQNIKEAKRIISKLYSEYVMNERTRTMLSQIQRRRPISSGPLAPSNFQSLKASVYAYTGLDKHGIDNRVWMLPANNSFQTDRKPQDPENGHLPVNALHCQESELYQLNFNRR